MLAIAVVDHRRMIIPDELNALAFIAGLIAAGVGTEAASTVAILQALVRASLMFALFFAFRAGYRTLRGMEGMGLGDVKLAAVAGVWLDWAHLAHRRQHRGALCARRRRCMAAFGAMSSTRKRGCPSALFSRQRSGFAGCSPRGAATEASPRSQVLAFPTAANAPCQGA